MRLFVCLMMVMTTVLSSVIPLNELSNNGNLSNNDELSASILEEIFDYDDLDVLYTFTDVLQAEFYGQDLETRDLEGTIESAINLLNSSGLIWTGLNYAVAHPHIVELLGNTTANLLNTGSSHLNSSLVSSVLGIAVSAAKGVNASALLSLVENSGLITSTLDGLLLDESFRPNISKIIYEVIESNMGLITLIGRQLLTPQNSKRADSDSDNSGSLLSFIGNFAGGLLNSQLLYSGLNDTLVALNDTGFIVYTLQRFLSNSSYVNMTGDLLSDVIKNTHLSISINISSIVEKALANPTALTGLVGDLLSGKAPNVSGILKRYEPGIKGIINDLQGWGLFVDLNNALFPSSSASNKQVTNTMSVSTVSDNSSAASNLNWLVMVQTLIFSIFFFT